jgi:hypothetical protein
MRKILFIIFISISLISCEKNVDLDLNDASSILVVDASIENGQPPVVILSKSFSYFAEITPQQLSNSFVHDADVTISNGSRTHKLREYYKDTVRGLRFYFYSIDTLNPATAIYGELNKSYNLKISFEGKDYTATTTIPTHAKRIDSLWWLPAPFNPDTTKVILMAKSYDPPGLGNYMRYFTKKNSGQFLPGENSVYDDQFTDGATYNVRVDPGIDRNLKVEYDDNYLHRGDTVTLKFCNIDKSTYQFWSTMEFAYQSIGNPFSSPIKVQGNISNGALGAFCGYAAVYQRLIIPR